MNITARTLLRHIFTARRANTVPSGSGLRVPLLLMAGLALLVMAGVADAAVSSYEPFDYAAGSLANGTAATGAGFTGNWTCGAAGTVVTGLPHAGLPVDNNALSSGGGRQSVSLSSPLSTGTKWISFLFKSSAGDPGANKNGVFFPNSNATCLWIGFGLAPYSATQGQLGLGSMTTAGTGSASATSLQQLGLGTYGNTYLVVLQVQFNTAGDNDTVTVYLNPAASQATPGVAAAGTNSAFDVGAISGVGLNVQGAGTITVDEIRVGDSYGDVVGYVGIPPDAPTGLNATTGSNLVSLNWVAATGSPTSYNVKRSANSGGPYLKVGATTAPTVTYNDSVLGGQTYYYVVSAVNGAGESADSSQVSASPTLAAPAVPAGLAAIAGDSQVTLSWQASPFATSYNVMRATALAGPYTSIGATTAPTQSYTDTNGLANGTTYYYVASATGAGGTSAVPSPVSATPVGPLPLVIAITRGAGITWFASNNVTYQVQWTGTLPGTNTLWNNLGSSIAGNGATNTVFDAAGQAHHFYQVLSIQ
jgi:hypothetical protein